jgi:multiple sugar transport system ATP-binding protein
VIIDRLTKVFRGDQGGSLRALNEVSLTVEDKELLVVVGPSGCGKTTLLRLIAGLDELTSGSIMLDGQVLNQLAPRDRDVVMVFQNPALYPHMSVYENMAFGLKVRKCSKPEIQRRVSEAAELLGLANCLDREPMALSGGERQRVALGRAMVRRPKLFLLDEPLSNLDPLLRTQMRLEIAKMQKELGATFIFVTHDQVEALTLGDRVAVLCKGEIRQVAEPLGLYQNPADLFVGGFIGCPSMNFFPGRLEQSNGSLFVVAGAPASDARLPMSLSVDSSMMVSLGPHVGENIVLGIRPEHVVLGQAALRAGIAQAFEAVVEVVDPLGAEAHLRLAACGHLFVARYFGTQVYQVGQKIWVGFDMCGAYFFDASSGKRLTADTNKCAKA